MCGYKDIFGKPNTGIHSIRFMDVAVIDVLLTICVAIIIARLFHIPYLLSIIGFFVLGIIMHRIFCVRTTVDKLLFD